MTKRPGSPPPKATRKFPVVAVVFVAVAALLVAAIVLSGGSSDDDGDLEVASSEITGEPLPLLPDTGAAQPEDDPAFGLPAPEVAGQDYAGNPVSITHDGVPKAILFLAHWCNVCQSEVPEVQAWLDDGGGVEGVELISVSTSVSSVQANYPPSEWLERENWTPPVIADDADSSVLEAYGGGAFPFWVFLDAEGNVEFRIAGGMDGATLQGVLELLGG